MANLEIVDKDDMFWHGLPDQVGQRLSFKSREEKFAPFPNLPTWGEMSRSDRGGILQTLPIPPLSPKRRHLPPSGEIKEVGKTQTGTLRDLPRAPSVAKGATSPPSGEIKEADCSDMQLTQNISIHIIIHLE
jgi:hypothetical protein